MSDNHISADDVRRALEAHGFTRALERHDLMRVAKDAYSEAWEPSQHLQMDHEKALGHALKMVFDHLQETNHQAGR